ncbi:MAG: hypothetical protein ACJ8BW_02685 [Ktedonobacteraceae bacterium]
MNIAWIDVPIVPVLPDLTQTIMPLALGARQTSSSCSGFLLNTAIELLHQGLVPVSVMSTHLIALLQEVLGSSFSIENLADLCTTICRTFRVCAVSFSTLTRLTIVQALSRETARAHR